MVKLPNHPKERQISDYLKVMRTRDVYDLLKEKRQGDLYKVNNILKNLFIIYHVEYVS